MLYINMLDLIALCIKKKKETQTQNSEAIFFLSIIF